MAVGKWWEAQQKGIRLQADCLKMRTAAAGRDDGGRSDAGRNAASQNATRRLLAKAAQGAVRKWTGSLFVFVLATAFPGGHAAFAKAPGFQAAGQEAGQAPGGQGAGQATGQAPGGQAASQAPGSPAAGQAADQTAEQPANRAAEQAVTDRTAYTASVQIDPAAKELTGSVHIQFVPQDPAFAYLHVYPYAFTDKKKGPLWADLLGKNPTPGTYQIHQLRIQGKPAAYQRTGTLVEIPLEKRVVESGAALDLELQFSMTLPRNMGRMSYDDHAIWLGNWLPILAVRDSSGWHLDPYGPVGDPFYSETADYQVELNVPAGYQVASTAADGTQRGEEATPGQRVYHLEAKDVRDFSLVVMDETYQRRETTVGRTKVRSWWRKGDSPVQAARNHQAAERSFSYFQSRFGAYPYDEYDVVRIGGRINGMEYPGIVFLDGSHYQGDHLASIPTVVHETAHQWFYGLMGNNQVEEAWLDEGLAEYASLSFLRAAYPQIGQMRVQGRLIRGTTADAYAEAGLNAWLPTSRYPDNQSYSDLVYSRTATMLLLLEDVWGEERLHAMLQHFLAEHRHQVATGREWVAALTAEAGEDAAPFIRYWLLLDKEQEQAAQEWLDRQREARVGRDSAGNAR
ncbi:M1 family metallopeptidase [Brevibacillus composti]|nr:M1 family metallopeptidase [Brevibacillus composti]